MRRIGRLLVACLAFAAPATAGIAVREAHGRIDVAAQAAPLADVLDRLAKQIGMKVVYEGAAPRQLITLSLVGRSAAEAVTAILEGQGLNYALILDASATRVQTLLVTGAVVAGSRPARPLPTPHRYNPPPEPEPEPEDLPEEPPAPDAPPPSPSPELPQPPDAPLGPNGLPLPPSAFLPPGQVLPSAPVVPPGAAPPGAPVIPTAPGAGPAPQPTPTPPP